MKILIAGSSGFIGQYLVHYFRSQGNQVVRLLRWMHDSHERDVIFWNESGQGLNAADLEGYDVVINLAGENIAGRWTKAKKQAILNTRVNSTKALVQVLTTLKFPPKVYLNASAIGFYGNRGSQVVDESSSLGSGFLASVCSQWEEAAKKAEPVTRVVLLRFGVVLSKNGGALKQMLPAFKWGLGGIIGSGEQFMSWIGIEDVAAICQFVIQTPSISGPVNVVAPNPVTNDTFTKTLGKVLRRPTFLPLPAFLARFILGEMADEMLLSSTRVSPKKLLDAGYVFITPEIEAALLQVS